MTQKSLGVRLDLTVLNFQPFEYLATYHILRGSEYLTDIDIPLYPPNLKVSSLKNVCLLGYHTYGLHFVLALTTRTKHVNDILGQSQTV